MTKRFPSQQEYLDALGVTGLGDEARLAEARRAHRRAYQAWLKREHRKRRREFHPAFSKKECGVLERQARRHGTSVTAYIRGAALAYAGLGFLVPDEARLRELEVLLNQIYHLVRSSPSATVLVNHLEHRFDEIMRRPPLCPGCSLSHAHQVPLTHKQDRLPPTARLLPPTQARRTRAGRGPDPESPLG